MSPRPQLPFFGKKREVPDTFTVLDIGTATVKALVIKREGNQGIVVGASKVDQRVNDMQAGAVANIQSVIDTCDKALTEAEDMCDIVPSRVIIGIAGEQVYGKMTSVVFPRQQPAAKITEAELASAIQLVQRRALREAIKEMSSTLGVDEINVKLVHSVITAILIDGHSVASPIDFQGQRITITVFNTFAPITHIGALQTIADELDLDLIATVAEPYALARACTNETVQELGGVFVDIGGGTSDVAFVRNGVIEAMKMCALGGRSFTRRLMTEMSMGFVQAEKFKRSYTANEVPLEQRSVAHDLFVPTAEVIAQAIGLIMEELSRDVAPPVPLFLAGGGSILPEVVEQLKQLNWRDFAPYEYQPTIMHLAPEHVGGMYDTTGLLIDAQDVTPLAIGRYALTMEDQEDAPLDSLMQRVLRTMKV